MTMAEARDAARIAAEKVRNDPAGRLALREAFYHAHPSGPIDGDGNSELAFTRWEIARGVLNPDGSPWWRAVNEGILFPAQVALEAMTRGVAHDHSDRAVSAWMAWLDHSTGTNWYRAHNTSVILGYAANEDAARQESADERAFLAEVLYRVVFAHLMEESWGATAPLRALSRAVADPRLPSVDILLKFHNFYPDCYPMTAHEAKEVAHRSWGPGGLLTTAFDRGLILPRVVPMFKRAAGILQTPELLAFLVGNDPVYPPAR